MVDGGETRKLHEQDKNAAANADEDLAHDDVAYGLVGLPEVDHETQAEGVDGDCHVEKPLEAPRAANGVADDEEEDAGDYLEG